MLSFADDSWSVSVTRTRIANVSGNVNASGSAKGTENGSGSENGIRSAKGSEIVNGNGIRSVSVSASVNWICVGPLCQLRL